MYLRMDEKRRWVCLVLECDIESAWERMRRIDQEWKEDWDKISGGEQGRASVHTCTIVPVNQARKFFKKILDHFFILFVGEKFVPSTEEDDPEEIKGEKKAQTDPTSLHVRSGLVEKPETKNSPTRKKIRTRKVMNKWLVEWWQKWVPKLKIKYFAPQKSNDHIPYYLIQ